jgi:hypothetical protein
MVAPQKQEQIWGRDSMPLTMNFRPVAWTFMLAAMVGLSPPLHAADEWPTRDITFYVPYAPGGSTDPISRKYAELLEKQLKVKVIVENKPGASATIGTGGGDPRCPGWIHHRVGLQFVAGLPAARDEGAGLEIGR